MWIWNYILLLWFSGHDFSQGEMGVKVCWDESECVRPALRHMLSLPCLQGLLFFIETHVCHPDSPLSIGLRGCHRSQALGPSAEQSHCPFPSAPGRSCRHGSRCWKEWVKTHECQRQRPAHRLPPQVDGICELPSRPAASCFKPDCSLKLCKGSVITYHWLKSLCCLLGILYQR